VILDGRMARVCPLCASTEKDRIDVPYAPRADQERSSPARPATSGEREPFAVRLAAAGRELVRLCLGLDPTGCRDAAELERFCAEMLEAALPHVVAVKPNLAFFEQHGSEGLRVLERVRGMVPESRLLILDAKRATSAAPRRRTPGPSSTCGGRRRHREPVAGPDAVEPSGARWHGRPPPRPHQQPGCRRFLEAPLQDGRPSTV